MHSKTLPGPLEWLVIPGGTVTLVQGGYLTQPTPFEIETFVIAATPVTNRQYSVFMEAGGYTCREWWTADGWALRERKSWTRPRFWGQGNFTRPDCPVIGVSFYEAIAFCGWLSALSGDSISLPTEQQWQRAAQGDDGREYPWGNDWPDEIRCNWNRNVGTTTPVTQYPDGISPYGVMDMSGNVWELCLTGWETGSTAIGGDDRRIVRGGCWVNDSPLTLRTVLRDGPYPVDGYNLFGFRCVRLS